MPASSSTTRRWGPFSAVMRPPSWRVGRRRSGRLRAGPARGSEIETVVPRPGVGVDANRAAVLLDDPVDDREAEPGAAGKAVGEGREEPVALVGRHPVALVRERHVPVTLPRSVAETASVPPPGIAARALRATFQKICRSWPGSAWTTTDGGSKSARRRWRDETSSPCASSVRTSSRAAGASTGSTARSFGRTYLQEVLQDRGQAMRLGDDDLHESLLGRPRRGRVLQDLDRPGDRGERVADLVRDSGRELADGRELVLEAHLALEPLELA